MEFMKLIHSRFSVRKFDNCPVEESKITAVLEAGRAAPTAHNKQPQRILVLRDTSGMEKLQRCVNSTFGAPAALIICYDKDQAWTRPSDNSNSGIIDATIVATHIMLAVHELGLGTTWLGNFKPDVLRQTFALPETVIPVAVLPIGYPDDAAKPAGSHEKRCSLEETVIYDGF